MRGLLTTGRSLTFKKSPKCVQIVLLNRVARIGEMHERNRTELGIRYASAPRFAKPERLERWTSSASFGPSAPQPERPVGLLIFGESGPTAEECLYLNVCSAGGDGKPVIVFVHGGGFTVGSGRAGISHGARLARAADAV